MKHKEIRVRAVAGMASFCLFCFGGLTFLSGCSDGGDIGNESSAKTSVSIETSESVEGGKGSENGEDKESKARRRRPIEVDYLRSQKSFSPTVLSYQVDADLSNVKDIDRFFLSEEALEKLAKNQFVVVESQSSEFFNIYESNRYAIIPNFITTDSMMHTYHLYFAMLQENTERTYLIGNLEKLTGEMLANSLQQYETVKGSEWEEAALLNVAYFGVAGELLGLNPTLPAEATELTGDEVAKIVAAGGIEESLITKGFEDYTQYKPRGYYDGDEKLEKYFRAMMWYGRMNFDQKSETMNRCALLMTLAMDDEDCYRNWDSIYEVTAFFVGQSDDLGYYDYLPVIVSAYGGEVKTEKLIGNQSAWNAYQEGIKTLRAPEINSVVFEDDGGQTDKTEEAKGFRFMGQRFTMDAAVFTQLCYGKVKEAADGSKRMLPDALDVPAAMGSDLALELLKKQGNDKYPNYLFNMEKVRDKIEKADDYWSSSLYGGWLYTLNPLLEQKGEGYPYFMRSPEWQKKSLEAYLGSWTELKHDTVLYAKQMMAEMGGGDMDEYDDRGYVEPEPELYSRLYALTVTTSEGLDRLGVITSEDKEGLGRLGELAGRLQEISVKELQNEALTDEEYELIRDYGGTLEHLWVDTVKNKKDSTYYDSAEFPMALVTDVATDPNGACLQEAIGGASRIYVIFPLDGELHVGVGGVFNYYQFEQPISDRLTDKEWRIRIGMQLDDDDSYHYDRSIKGPDWTQSYRYCWSYEY